MAIITRATKDFPEEGTGFITCAYKDRNGDAVTPTAVVWSLRDDDDAVVNNRTEVVINTPTTSDVVTLEGDDLAITAGADNGIRHFVMEATYNSDQGNGKKIHGQLTFKIRPLAKIS